MNKTFTRETINGKRYQFLTLPGSDLFKFEVVNLMGAHAERVVQKVTGRNVYGLCHLDEHLGFRCFKDYSTDEIMQALKNEGAYNASTDHERINYWFKTTSSRMKTAIRLVCNYSLNDLSTLTEDEFKTEQKTVYNEVKQYMDDDQTMFYFSGTPTFCGYAKEDNILGTPETVAAATLDDVRFIKGLFLSCGENVFNIIYDPLVLSKEEIVATVETEVSRFPIPDLAPIYNEIKTQYLNLCSVPEIDDFIIDNESEQAMTMLLFNVVDNDIAAAKIGNKYLSRLSPSSLTDIIREKNGLTYGVQLHDSQMSYTPYVMFACDVTRGTENQMMNLFEQSVKESVEAYDRDTHARILKTNELQRTLMLVDQEKYNYLFWTSLWNPEVVDAVEEEFAVNVDRGIKAIDQKLTAYEHVKEYLDRFYIQTKERKYGKMTNVLQENM